MTASTDFSNSTEFSKWLAERSWNQAVRFSVVVAVINPVAAVAIDLGPIKSGTLFSDRVALAIFIWHIVTEIVLLGMLAVQTWLPQVRRQPAAVYAFSGIVVVQSTWIGICTWFQVGDFSIWALGLFFVATVAGVANPHWRLIYLASALVIAIVVLQNAQNFEQSISILTNPACVVVICMLIDQHTREMNLDLFREKSLVVFERQRADNVLYNVLPASIADELKANDRVNAVKFDRMAVMFADIVGFTSFSKSLPPDALVLVLNQIFSSFDRLVEARRLEKIKTIGDAYMVVAVNDLANIAHLAIELINEIDSYNNANGTAFQLRIGLHVGPTVAGIIGIKRFVYDVWGDTVNVASRMESSGAPNRIHVTEAVYENLKEEFEFEFRGNIELKGKGLVTTYFLGNSNH